MRWDEKRAKGRGKRVKGRDEMREETGQEKREETR